ncbi:MAG: ABC transporter permease [Candidatus Diapherotrites archaeon]|nr:ABC transporter permease [Candidatus Diapherotrites archaeon]
MNLQRKKLRTFLSVGMIAVGVLAIILMTALADGLFLEIKNTISQVQGIIVFERSAYGPIYAQTDEKIVYELRRMPGIKKATPVITALTRSIDGKETPLGSMSMTGTIRLFGTVFEKSGQTVGGVTGEILKGRNLQPGEKGSVVIGEGISDDYRKFVGNKIKINDKQFVIVGVYRTGSKLFNYGILMDIDELRDLISFPKNKVTQISVELENPENSEKMAKLIKFKLGDNYRVVSSSQFTESLSGVLGNIRLLVMAVASIASLVAAVGILNTMLMSVMERYKEIGILKASGWTNGTIIKMILYESTIIGVFGGVLGLMFGVLIADYLYGKIPVRLYISPALAIESFLFAVLIGLFAGLYPAWKASKFDPIEALRAE